jgi:ribosome-associated protein
MNESQALLNCIGQALFDKKAFNILAIDVRSVSDLTDFCVIAEANVDRHVKALAHNVAEEAKKLQLSPHFIEGELEGDWVVIDFGDVIVHIMLSDMREKYALEKLWKDGQIVDLEIDVKKVTAE